MFFWYVGTSSFQIQSQDGQEGAQDGSQEHLGAFQKLGPIFDRTFSNCGPRFSSGTGALEGPKQGPKTDPKMEGFLYYF